MVSIMVGSLMLGQAKIRDFGVMVKEAEWVNIPVSQCIADLERMGKFKVKVDCELVGTVTLLMQNAPAPIILEQAVFQQNLMVEKRDGVMHIVKIPLDRDESHLVSPPFQEAALLSGMKILGPWLGIHYRCETEFCNEKVYRFSRREKDPPFIFLYSFLKNCGATYEIEKGVYVIKDGYWSVPKKFGGGLVVQN